MRSLAIAIGAVILLNLLAVLGFVGWLGASGRLSSNRVHQAVHLFEPTIAQEKAKEQKAAQEAKKKKQQADEAARLASVANGPTTVQQRLSNGQQASDVTLERLSRLKVEVNDLRQEIQLAKQHLAKEQKKLDTKRKEFEQYVKAHQKKIQDKQFQRTVQMYESVRPSQAKQMFQQLIQQHKTDQVVDYLDAMQVRKAAKVLQQFQTPSEVAQATMLLQKLRARGSDPLTAQNKNKSNGGQT